MCSICWLQLGRMFVTALSFGRRCGSWFRCSDSHLPHRRCKDSYAGPARARFAALCCHLLCPCAASVLVPHHVHENTFRTGVWVRSWHCRHIVGNAASRRRHGLHQARRPTWPINQHFDSLITGHSLTAVSRRAAGARAVLLAPGLRPAPSQALVRGACGARQRRGSCRARTGSRAACLMAGELSDEEMAIGREG